LNGKPVKQAEVKDFTKNINIGVDNLCQFLPQEKVADFVKMGPKDLLENTEKAAGDNQLYEDHVKLREMTRNKKQLSKEKKQMEEKTRTEENVNRRAEQEVQRLKERKEAEAKVKVLNLKKPWCEFEEKRIEFVEEKKTLEELQRKKAIAQKKIEPFKKHYESLIKEFNKQENEMKAKKQAVRNTIPRQSNIVKEIRKVTETTNAKKDEFSSKLHEFERRQEDIKRIKQDIRNTEVGLEKMREEDVLTQLMGEVDAKLKNHIQKISGLEGRKDQLRDNANNIKGKIEDCRERLKRMDTFEKRCELLRSRNLQAHRGLEIYFKIRNRFRKQVYPPIMTVIDVKEPVFAKYVEACIPKRDLFAFVCEDGEDMKMFSRELETNRVRCALIMAPSPDIEFTPRFHHRDIKSLGFARFVSELYTAPEAVQNYLYNQYRHQDVPVAGDNKHFTPSQIQASQDRGIGLFFANERRYNSSQSRYDNSFILTQDLIQNPTNLTIMREESGVERERQKIADLEEELKLIDDKVKEVDDQIKILKEDNRRRIQEEKRGLQGELEEVQTAKKKLQLKKAELKKKETSTFDKEAELRQIKSIVTEAGKKLMQLLKDSVKMGKETVRLIEEHFKMQVVNRILDEKKSRTEISWRNAQKSLSSLTQALSEQETRVDTCKTTAKKYREAAVRSLEAQGYKMNGNQLPDEVKEKFDSLPETLVELQAEISALNAKIQGMGDEWNNQAEEDYNRRSEEIRANKARIEDLGFHLQQIESEMSIIKLRWLTPLNSMIAKINKSFSESMKSLGYAGEVTLRGEDDNFEEYGIVVRVKYRDDEDVQELSAFTQSGGERSVATVIYMMALQELTSVPFRAVDEINQGMDSTNERKVFNLIVKNAVNNSSQYFLLTPKLLKGLAYPDKIEVHDIYNGSEVEKDFAGHIADDFI
jgi:chromosome segregation ATPase